VTLSKRRPALRHWCSRERSATSAAPTAGMKTAKASASPSSRTWPDRQLRPTYFGFSTDIADRGDVDRIKRPKVSNRARFRELETPSLWRSSMPAVGAADVADLSCCNQVSRVRVVSSTGHGNRCGSLRTSEALTCGLELLESASTSSL